ncbi:Immunoglobulin lambda variable 5-45 [Varanus komodoensis]|nr:Immunoglobulin lambda variable 5-45 [Varanus komodoensis]
MEACITSRNQEDGDTHCKIKGLKPHSLRHGPVSSRTNEMGADLHARSTNMPCPSARRTNINGNACRDRQCLGLSSRVAGDSDLSAMFWATVLSLLVIWGTGSHSQLVLTQPPSTSVSLGNTVRLSCAFSSGVSVSGQFVQWFQQKPGSPPRYLLSYYSDSIKEQGSGVPARFSGSKDTSTNSGILTISGVQAEDEADYYCGTAHGSGSTAQLAQ